MDIILDDMPKLIEEEARDAIKYARLALEHRADHPGLSDLFIQLSGEELKHMQMIAEKLADMIGKIRTQYNNA